MSNTRTRPVRASRVAYIGRILVHGFLLGLAFHLASAVGVMNPVNTTAAAIDAEPASVTRPAKATATERLMERHGCWSGEAPADMVGELPGHVVTDRGYGGSRMVGLALEQTFAGVDHGLTVHGFCR